MRILAIRGKNLASLEGEFDVDFRREPLASAGLYAISGPTGAGKSTLLDALCLALYEDTPRLARAGGRGVELPDVAGKTMSPHDPCSLIRRGCVEGYAEVEFVGNDDRSYRARWSVRRAYGKADRPFQDTQMSLIRLDDNLNLGGRKTEVLAEIEKLLGLSFEQFTRAVLLAQNEFSAFLKANDDDRSKLLEALTGTQHYSLISQRAYERHRDEQQKLNALRLRLDGQKPLDEAARQTLQAERATLEARLRTLAAEQEQLARQLRWHADYAEAGRVEREAVAVWDTATAHHAAAEPRRRELAQTLAVQPARVVLERYRHAAHEREASLAAVARDEPALFQATETLHTAEAAAERARLTLALARQQQRDAAADLDRAKALDGTLAELQTAHADSERELAVAQQNLAAAEAQSAEQQRRQADYQAQRQIAAAWLEGKAVLKALAESWLRWDEVLGQAALAEAEAVTARQGHDRGAQELAQAQRQHQAALAESQREQHAATQAANDHAEAEQRCAAFDIPALTQERRELDARRERLNQAQQLWQAGREAAAQQAVLAEQVAALAETQDTAAAELAAIAQQRPHAEALWRQAEKAWDIAKLACTKNIEQLRAGLLPDQPCPVCGATDHPYAVAASSLHDMLDTLGTEADRHQQVVADLAERETKWRTTLDLAQKQAAERQPALARAALEAERLAKAWQAEPLVAELAGIAETDYCDWFAAALAAIGERWTLAQKREDDAHAATAAREIARTAMTAAQARSQTAQQQASSAEAAWQRATDAQTQAATALAQVEQRRDSLIAQLMTVLPPESGWLEKWRENPSSFQAERRHRVEVYLDKQAALADLDQRLAVLETEIRAQTAAVDTSAGQVRQRETAFQDLDQRLRVRRSERERLFDGQPVAQVESALRAAVTQAEATEQNCAATVERARVERAGVETRLTQARTLLAQRHAQAEAATQALDVWLAQFNARNSPPLDVPQLQNLLDRDTAWIDAEQQALQALADAVNQTRAVVEERRRQREAIASRRDTEASAEDLEARQHTLATEWQAADAQRVDVEAQLRDDAQRRAATAQLQAELEQQDAIAQLWSQLNLLIGSHDGKKFRAYAQQLTLQVLLGYANQHLADLSRRYRLDRVPDKLALMVVDRDMGDEVRSVHSLSGGESFLVSLALALGLASLSSNRVRVESLFIDEGFGSLDADTLRVAMEALDCLHAQGRKVGVISHVQEMTERIGTRIQVKRLAGGRSKVVVG